MYPSNIEIRGKNKWNSLISWKSALGHELVGHRDAGRKNQTQEDDILEEIQASIRAARFTPELTFIERIILIRDALARLPEGVKIRDVKDKLFICER